MKFVRVALTVAIVSAVVGVVATRVAKSIIYFALTEQARLEDKQ